MPRLRWLSLTLLLACKPGAPFDVSETDGETGDGETGDDDGDPIGLSCDPSDAQACELAGGLCCSDDPAALLLDDLEAQVTPAYLNRGGDGTPIFSGGNNALRRWGQCVAEGSVPDSDALVEAPAAGCPIPCNPTWSASDVAEICGSNRVCCQTVELEPADCVLDPGLGDAGCWRPVAGNDITGLGGIDATDWSASDHATHQDPSGLGCQSFVAGIPADVLSANDVTETEVLVACFRRLGVANLRGLCTAAASCPMTDPNDDDACEQINMNEGRVGCP